MASASTTADSRPVLVLVDVSSVLVHLAFHSQIAYLKISKTMPEGCDVSRICDEPIFKERYARKVSDLLHVVLPRSVRALHGKNAAFEVVLAHDCLREDTWRRAAFPQYKENRATRSQAFDPRVFYMLNETVLPALAESSGTPYRSLSMPTAEADDIIAVVALAEHATGRRVMVVTSDTDYVQLPVDVVDAKGCGRKNALHLRHSVCARLGLDPESSDAPKQLLIHKAIEGDKADNIPSIYEGLRGVRRQPTLTLATDPSALATLLAGNAELASRMERNLDLIDMTRIPAELADKIRGMVQALSP